MITLGPLQLDNHEISALFLNFRTVKTSQSADFSPVQSERVLLTPRQLSDQ